MVRVIRNYEDTRVSDTRFLQVGSHSRHLHLNGLSWLNLTLLQFHLQAHRKHLHAADIQFRLTLIGNQNLTLQLLLSIETTQIEIVADISIFGASAFLAGVMFSNQEEERLIPRFPSQAQSYRQDAHRDKPMSGSSPGRAVSWNPARN